MTILNEVIKMNGFALIEADANLYSNLCPN